MIVALCPGHPDCGEEGSCCHALIGEIRISVSVLSSAVNEFAEIVVWRARPLRSARARNWRFPVSVASHSAGSSRPPVVERSHEPWMPG